MPPPPLTAVVLAAGMSSRFGGRVKGLTVVGANNETLLEISLRQLQACGVTDYCVIVSAQTRAAIEGLLGSIHAGLPVVYAEQVTPAWRAKPLGTVDALLAARPLLHHPFIVLNADCIYGEPTLRLVCDYLLAHSDDNTACCPGFPLKLSVPSNGSKVNRALFTTDAAHVLVSLVELYDISTRDVGSTYSGDELVSFNVFGLRPAHLAVFQTCMDRFLAELAVEQAAPPAPPPAKNFTVRELILADAVNSLRPLGNISTVVVGPSTVVPLEITHPEDVSLMVADLRAMGL